jgi:hypothetical protein
MSPTTTPPPPHRDQDLHKGTVEGTRPSDEQQGNDNATALDDSGMPSDPVAIAEDEIGANEDQTQG